MCPRLIKYLAAFCMLNCFYAATLPSAPAPKFEADTITVLFATLLPPSALSFGPRPVPVPEPSPISALWEALSLGARLYSSLHACCACTPLHRVTLVFGP